MSPKGVYPHTHIKPREYPAEIVELVRRLYIDEGMTVAEVSRALPKGFKAQRIIERHVPVRRPATKREQSGSANDSWRGDGPGYSGAHARLYRCRGPANAHACVDCGELAKDWSYSGGCPRELTDPKSGCRYSPDPDRYEPRCRKCHRAHDRIGGGAGDR